MPLGIRYGSQLCRNAVRCFKMAGTMMVVYYTMPLGMGHVNLIAYLTAGIYDVCVPIPAISVYLAADLHSWLPYLMPMASMKAF